MWTNQETQCSWEDVVFTPHSHLMFIICTKYQNHVCENCGFIDGVTHEAVHMFLLLVWTVTGWNTIRQHPRIKSNTLAKTAESKLQTKIVMAMSTLWICQHLKRVPNSLVQFLGIGGFSQPALHRRFWVWPLPHQWRGSRSTEAWPGAKRQIFPPIRSL